MTACFAGLLDDLYRFSPVSSVWEEVAQGARLTARAQHRISALGGRIYIFGGFGDSGMCRGLHLDNADMILWAREP